MITGEFRQLSTDISDTGIWLAFPSPFNFFYRHVMTLRVGTLV